MMKVLLAVGLWVMAAAASAQAIDPARSSITATFKQMGVPVEGKFTKVGGEVVYDPAQPAAARARADVEVASFTLGDPQYDAEIRKKEWFDAARFPRASFVTNAVKATGPGRLEATGVLTIKGRGVPVTVPLTVRSEGGARLYEGATTIKRLAFAIGEGDWTDTGMVADEVVVKFRLVTGP